MLFQKRQRILFDRERDRKITEREKEAALLQLDCEPMRPYMMALMDEVIRQGIYLSPQEQEGAKFFLKIMGEELRKARQLTLKRKPKV